MKEWVPSIYAPKLHYSGKTLHSSLTSNFQFQHVTCMGRSALHYIIIPFYVAKDCSSLFPAFSEPDNLHHGTVTDCCWVLCTVTVDVG